MFSSSELSGDGSRAKGGGLPGPICGLLLGTLTSARFGLFSGLIMFGRAVGVDVGLDQEPAWDAGVTVSLSKSTTTVVRLGLAVGCATASFLVNDALPSNELITSASDRPKHALESR